MEILILLSTVMVYVNSLQQDWIIFQKDLNILKEEEALLEQLFNITSIIETVNSAKTTWTAGQNFPPETPWSHYESLAGTLTSEGDVEDSLEETTGKSNDKVNLPKEFNAIKKWGNKCKNIAHVYDQGKCSSCWAVSAASSITDRLCIKRKGKFNAKISAQNIISNCHKCSPVSGCDGGYPVEAWNYMEKTGVVTGGEYNSKEGCQPYLIQPCDQEPGGRNVQCKTLKKPKTPKGGLSCYNRGYKVPYNKDIHKTNKYKRFKKGEEKKAMEEIYLRGPITASFDMYTDFLTYKKGVYHHVTGRRVGGHTVRVYGWGIEQDKKYWLAINSWNDQWGDLKGHFKILRGHNECNFENLMIAADVVK